MSMVLMAMGMPAAHAGPAIGVGVVVGHVNVNGTAEDCSGGGCLRHVVPATLDPIPTTYVFTATQIIGAIRTTCGIAVGGINVTATGASLEENQLSASGTVTITGVLPIGTHVGTIGIGGLPSNPGDFTGHFIRLGPVVIVHLTFSEANFGTVNDCEFQVVVAALFVPTPLGRLPNGLIKLAAFIGVFVAIAALDNT